MKDSRTFKSRSLLSTHQHPNVFKYAKFDTFALCCLDEGGK